ncbi:MAG TPA: hypothetical protein VGK74_14490 [Symbiobacteriaceae bacterium]|jgi:hypothetical protein
MWDRWLLIAVAAGIAVRTAWWAWKLGRDGDWLAGVGGLLLAVVALGVPLLLAVLGPATGR